jgi:hypothetical protein
LQEALLGLAGWSELERCQVRTPRVVAAAEAAQEVRASRWQQVVPARAFASRASSAAKPAS